MKINTLKKIIYVLLFMSAVILVCLIFTIFAG